MMFSRWQGVLVGIWGVFCVRNCSSSAEKWTCVSPWLEGYDAAEDDEADSDADDVDLGKVVQVDPTKPMLKAPGTKRLKPKYDELLSKFAFKFNLRRYTSATSSCPTATTRRARRRAAAPAPPRRARARQGITHSSTVQLNLSRFGHKSTP